MPELTLADAEARLRAHGGYDWVLSGQQAWSAAEVAQRLGEMGIRVSKDTVTRWFKTLLNTQDFGGLGLYASRADLVLFLASRNVRDAVSDDQTA